VPIGDKRDDAGAERGAGRHVGGRLSGDGLGRAVTSGKLIRVVTGLIADSSTWS
jgi:hypothetical protein